jgi:putative hydrolase of the HAD superfamily
MSNDSLLLERIRTLTSPLTPQPTGMHARLRSLAGIRAVLFDVYGTLVISGSGDIGLTRRDAGPDPLRDALAAAGLDVAGLPQGLDAAAALVRAIESSHRRSREQGVDYPEVDILSVWAELLTGLGLAVDAASVQRVAVEYELRSNPVWPMPGLAELLAALAARPLVVGIVSNAQFYTPLMLHAFLGRDLAAAGVDPACCAWSYRHGVGKPSLGIYRPALDALRDRYSITPGQVLYIGNDIRNDIWPADRLGCRTALFAGDARSLRLREDDERLSDVKPDRVVTALGQIHQQILPVRE